LTLEGHTSTIYCLKVTQYGDVATGSWDTTVKIWDTNTGKCKVTFPIDSSVRCLEVHTDNRIILGLANSDIQIWDVSAGECLEILKCDDDPESIRCLGILPNGNIISGYTGGKIQIWDGQTVILNDGK
jgi:WD40 repeat protein